MKENKKSERKCHFYKVETDCNNDNRNLSLGKLNVPAKNIIYQFHEKVIFDMIKGKKATDFSKKFVKCFTIQRLQAFI